MIDRHLVESRLASIRDHVGRIRGRLPHDRDHFLADRGAQETVTVDVVR